MPETTDRLHLTEPLPAAAQEAIGRLERAFGASEEEVLAKVRKALGFVESWMPVPELGETATRVLLWSQLELNSAYERLGGTVTSRPVQRPYCDGDVVVEEEIILTVLVDGVGPVEMFTDWCEDLAKYGSRDELPVMCAVVGVGRCA